MQSFLTSTTSLIIGNLIACVAAFFTIKSSLVTGQHKIYFYQFMQCATMILASLFFYSFSGMITFAFCALRMFLCLRERFNTKWLISTSIALTAIGLYVNNRGVIGLLPIIATIIYGIGAYYFHKDVYLKMNIALDLIFWVIYDSLILDLVSMSIDAVTVVITILYIYRHNIAHGAWKKLKEEERREK